jgi:hypothetical protein
LEALDGFDLTDFASWVYTKDKFKIPGNFEIPSNATKVQKNEAKMKAL